jgi:hypothetical protein
MTSVTIGAMARPIPLALCAAALVIAALPAAADAGSTPARHCKSADLRYPFQPGGPNDFGVFRLQITGGKCATAHRVAKSWMNRFEANLRDGEVKLPRHVRGFTFKTLPATAAQTYRERGRKGTKTIRFNYRVPNG